MLKSNYTSGLTEQVDITNELFENLSISLESRFSKQKHIIPKPKPKRLVKLKSSSASVSATTFCSRCRKETSVFPDDHGSWHNIPEKEVEVKKKRYLPQKKVHFIGTCSAKGRGESTKEAINIDDDFLQTSEEQIPPSDFDSQTVLFPRRSSSIVGNNEFWLPQGKGERDGDKIADKEAVPMALEEAQGMCINTSIENASDTSTGKKEATSAEIAVVEFFNNIFKETIKREAKILHVTNNSKLVATMLENILVTLTDEYIFECRRSESTFEIMNAVPLKDVQAIMINDACTLIVLRVCRASTLTEFKEFVPGFPEKTESLISMMVYALSRLNGFLPHVNRLPLLSLPNYVTVQSWYLQQHEEIAYCGIAAASCISDPDYDFSGESFMMKTKERHYFHPVSLLLKYGQFNTKCNAGCNPELCKHSVKLELKGSVVTREDRPWPNSVRLKTECHQDVIVACSSKECSEDLVEKLYCCIQPSYEGSIHCLTCVLVTEYSLQLFRMTQNKTPLFGSPLLNLNISSNDSKNFSCFIETEGMEAGGDEMSQMQHRWQLDFLSIDEKSRFMTTSTVFSSD